MPNCSVGEAPMMTQEWCYSTSQVSTETANERRKGRFHGNRPLSDVGESCSSVGVHYVRMLGCRALFLRAHLSLRTWDPILAQLTLSSSPLIDRVFSGSLVVLCDLGPTFKCRGCVIALFVLNHRAFSQTNKVKTTVVEAATLVTDTIHMVTATLGRVEDKIENYHIPGWEVLNSTKAKLNEQADLVTAKIDRNVRKFNRLLDDVEIAISGEYAGIYSCPAWSVDELGVSEAVEPVHVN